MRRRPIRRRLRSATAAKTNEPIVIYVHGIANKPLPSVLKCQWDTALFGVDMGDRTRMAYWVDRERYPTPLDETCAAGDRLPARAFDELGVRSATLAKIDVNELAHRLSGEVDASPQQRKRLERLAREMLARSDASGPRVGARGRVTAKVIPLPRPIRMWVSRWLTGVFLQDVNDFLFHTERRERMDGALRARLDVGFGPYVVIAHSLGSVIAYDVLRALSRAKCRVPLFVTIGSPLGMDEVQDVLRGRSNPKGPLPVPECVERWVNVADRRDPVAADPKLANDYKGKTAIEDQSAWGLNPDSSNPHSASGYLSTETVRLAVRSVVGPQFAQPVRPFVIARNVVRLIEDDPETRHPVLIQAKRRATAGADESKGRADLIDAIQVAIENVVPRAEREQAAIDVLMRFVAANLTRSEVERLSQLLEAEIDYVWENARKRALIWTSSQRTQALPARESFRATGERIHWAVLDTGINADHPHFTTRGKTIVAQWDCTKPGKPTLGAPDRDGHGTHVAGIIAGEFPCPLMTDSGPVTPAGMAPDCKLHVYKVLNDEGEGRDSWIVKALDHVADYNERAGYLAIQGVNLSLGGDFDPSVYGCGHSPLCRELRRLWQQGVLVCIAAGNEGYAVLQSDDGERQTNLDLSIGDPANLEEAIAVGSVHKESPHIYGVSYFSSRGPTADGRLKPDLVAPGERVMSARHSQRQPPKKGKIDKVEKYYVDMSGTSMAAPHVSGCLAAFLSVRREFIGYPDRVKEILLGRCTDLKRDPYVQGRGLINVLQMLTST